jgi:hypothetical protein
MQYLLLISGDSSTWGTLPPDKAEAELSAFAEFERSASEAGVLVAQAALQPETETISVVDGSASQSERRPGCFYVLESPDIPTVKDWASQIPLVGPGGFDTIEVRALMERSVGGRKPICL